MGVDISYADTLEFKVADAEAVESDKQIEFALPSLWRGSLTKLVVAQRGTVNLDGFRVDLFECKKSKRVLSDEVYKVLPTGTVSSTNRVLEVFSPGGYTFRVHDDSAIREGYLWLRLRVSGSTDKIFDVGWAMISGFE